jgi:hypothetical protein
VVGVGGGGRHPPGRVAGGSVKDAKYLVGRRGTESRPPALYLFLVCIGCQLLAFTVRWGLIGNTKFELRIRIQNTVKPI